jgi:hypothetical protein
LAGNRAPSREQEQWLLWGLPLSRALLYYHCALRNAGAWTVPPLDRRQRLREAEAALAKIEAENFAAMADPETDSMPW